jgi:hypothetical protein
VRVIETFQKQGTGIRDQKIGNELVRLNPVNSGAKMLLLATEAEESRMPRVLFPIP